MADILARQRQIIGTTGEWGINDLVLGAGELALERQTDGTVRAKVGNGSLRFSNAPYLEGSLSIAAADARYVQQAQTFTEGGAPAANRWPRLNAQGKLDSSLLNLPSPLTYRGSVDPADPPPAGAVAGDVYTVNPGGTVDASWGPPAAGTVVMTGDMLAKDASGQWNVIPSATDTTGLVRTSDLAAPTGAGMVGTLSGLTVQQALDRAALIVPSRSELADIAGPANGAGVMLSEQGREGLFVFSTADLSAQVANDPRQGFYVPPTGETGASGAWVRRMIGGAVLASWFRDGSGDDTQAVRSMFHFAGLTTGKAEAQAGDWRYSGPMVMPQGVSLSGPASAVFKPVDQVTTQITAPVAAGTGQVSISVADTAAFLPGRNVILVSTTAHTVSPNDSFNHRGRFVQSRSVASGPGTVTLAAGAFIGAHAAGDLLALSTMGIVQTGNNVIEGVTFDGNAASHTYAHWITSCPVIQEGDNCRRRGITIQNTPSDAILAGGPSGGEIVGVYDNTVTLKNIGGNGIHYGNARGIHAVGVEGYLGNVRYLLPVEQGGGAGNRLGHQDGMICLSNDVVDVSVAACLANDWITGVGAIGTTIVGGAQENDDINVTGCTFIDCFRPFEAIQTAKRLSFVGNRCRARYPFVSGSMRWASSTIYVAGDTVQGLAQGIVISDNVTKNVGIHVVSSRGAVVADNQIDMRELNADAAALQNAAYCIAIFSSTGFTVTGNSTNGGFVSLYLQNSYPLASNYMRDSVVADNALLNAFARGISGALNTDSQMNVDFRNNAIAARAGDTLENGTTPLTFSATWRATTAFLGSRYEDNRIAFDVPGAAAWDSGNAGVLASRWNNMVNGVRELPPVNAVDDAAAAAANVAIGARYRNGSVIMTRVA